MPWKLLFLWLLLMGSFIALSASSWLTAWIGLEINMLAFLAITLSPSTPRNSEAIMKYFLVQALASASLLTSALSVSVSFPFISSFSPSLFSSLLMMSLLLKLGAAPLHIWVPQTIEGTSWTAASLILTWQKLAPFCLMMMCMEAYLNKMLCVTFIISSALIGAIGGLNMSSTRKIIAFSSINHLGWMLSALMLNLGTWAAYFLSYSLMLIVLMNLLMKTNLTSLTASAFSQKNIKMSVFISLLSFGGLPPFLGFLPKWLILSQMASLMLSISLILVMSSLITLFFYLRLAFNSLLMKSSIINKPYLTHSLLPILMNSSGLILIPFFM